MVVQFNRDGNPLTRWLSYTIQDMVCHSQDCREVVDSFVKSLDEPYLDPSPAMVTGPATAIVTKAGRPLFSRLLTRCIGYTVDFLGRFPKWMRTWGLKYIARGRRRTWVYASHVIGNVIKEPTVFKWLSLKSKLGQLFEKRAGFILATNPESDIIDGVSKSLVETERVVNEEFVRVMRTYQETGFDEITAAQNALAPAQNLIRQRLSTLKTWIETKIPI